MSTHILFLPYCCPPEKLVLGLPLYGHTFQLRNANENGVRAPANGPGLAGPFTATSGTIGYNEFCYKLRTETWDLRYDDLAKVPYAVQGQNWVTYDDPNSLLTKVDYALQLNLAGAMVWSIETDDFHSLCQNEDFPLLRAINKGLGRLSLSTTTAQPAVSSTSAPVPSTTAAPSSTTSAPVSTTTVATTTTTQTTSSTTSAPSSSTTALPDETTICNQEGYKGNPKDCRSFYICIQGISNTYQPILLNCAANLYWDKVNEVCNYPELVECNIT